MVVFKPILTIKKIGYLRFYLGILIGVGYSVFVNLWLRLLDYTFFVLFDLFNEFPISPEAFYISSFNSLLLSLVSTTLGFSFTMYLWASNFVFEKKKVSHLNRFAHINSVFVFMLILFFLIRLLPFNTGLRYDGYGIDAQSDYSYLLFILPVFIFLFNWAIISRVFKSGKFIIFSGIAVAIFSIGLSKIQTPSVLITGFSKEELEEKIQKNIKQTKLLSENILGKWTNKQFSNLPAQPLDYIQSNDTIKEPHYHILSKQIKFFFYSEDTVNYYLESRDKSIIFKKPIQDFNGYQKKWRILNLSDSTITIERKYNTEHPYLQYYKDIIDTIKLEKKH